MFATMQAYKVARFDGVMTPNYTPRIAGDSPYRHRGMAFARIHEVPDAGGEHAAMGPTLNWVGWTLI